jgi:hypothetical protein
MTDPERRLELISEEDEDLCPGGEYPPLLTENKSLDVCATCTAVDIFPAYGRDNYMFTLMVFEPLEYEGTKLHCFAPFRDKWRTRPLPIGSKLFKLAVVATGQRRFRRITKKMFLGKAFVCRVRPTGTGDARYSVVDTFIKKLAG